ncbi:MAG: UTP--glucose-1-phosphate uridylyltransferase GalU [Pseudomonadota bacterium]
MKPIRKAVLPVAGMGTRVLPATKAIPKEMLPVFDRPALAHVVAEAREAGIEHFVFVTGRNKGAIEDYFDHAVELEAALEAKGKDDILAACLEDVMPAGCMSFVRQQKPLGLGHAVWAARDIVGDEPFAVLLPDVLVKAAPSCTAQMVEAYNQVGGNIVAVDEVPMERVSSYGVIAPKEGASTSDPRLIEMSAMVEKPPREDAPSNLKITGRYILQPEIFDLLESQDKGAGGEIQLTDSMATLMQSQSFYAFKYEGQDYDCGDKVGYLQAAAAYALADAEFGDKSRATLEALLRA